jgi:DNA-binding CsgD family transcriptional regulator
VSKTLGTKKRRRPRRRAILLATQEGKIQFADLPARRWLKQFFGRPPRFGTLPRKVSRWISTHHRAGSASLLGKKADAQLYVKREHSYTEDSVVLLLELIKGKSEERLRRHRQLTARERDVLFWLNRGKSNGEIGLILGIAGATVKKHLERIYPKLGVENRTAAATFAFEH